MFDQSDLFSFCSKANHVFACAFSGMMVSKSKSIKTDLFPVCSELVSIIRLVRLQHEIVYIIRIRDTICLIVFFSRWPTLYTATCTPAMSIHSVCAIIR